MANSIQTLTYIATEMLRQFKNNLQFIKNIDGQDYTNRFTESPKVGETFTVRKMALGTPRTGETYSASDYVERTVSMTVQQTDGIDFTLTNRELMFNVDQIRDKIVKPWAAQLAAVVDTKALKIASQATFNAVGTPGTVPSTLVTYNSARAKTSWASAPMANHSLLITPDMQVQAVDAAKALFNPQSNIGDQFEEGLIGRHYGAKVYEVQNPYVHTVGPLGGTPLVNGASQSGANLVTDGFTAAAASRLKKGDIFTIAGVNAVNPFTLASTGSLLQFTATADVSSDGSGNATIPISPSIVGPGSPYQNVSALPADNVALTVLGAAGTVSPVGLRFQKDAFLFGTCKQPEPGGVDFVKTVSDEQTGLSLRYIRDWDTTNNKQLNRIDVVWAFGVAFPEWSCRIHS